jgi:hypothetical protein
MNTYCVTTSKQPVKALEQPISHSANVKFTLAGDPDNGDGVIYFATNPKPAETGFALSAGQWITIELPNLGNVFFDGSRPGLRVRILEGG